MNFPDVKNWTIPEGSVKKVIDSQDRIIWQKDTYTTMDYVSTGDGDTWGGIIIPINIPRGATYEIGFDYRVRNLVEAIMSSYYSVTGFKNTSNLTGNNSYKYTYGGEATSSFGISYDIGIKENYSNLNNKAACYYGSNMPTYHQKLILDNSTKVRWYYDLDNNASRSASSTNYTKLNNSSDFTGFWGFGVIATGENTYLTDSTATTNKFKGDIYNCYIKVNGELICNLIPVRRDRNGQYGLYDEINEIFYPSCTNTPFTHTIVPLTSLTVYDNVAYVGRTYSLPFEYSPSNANVDLTWTSSDTSKAIVDNTGKITGVASTYTKSTSGYGYEHVPITVTATSNNSSVSSTCNIRVSPDGELTISPDPIRVKVDERARVVINRPDGFLTRYEGTPSTGSTGIATYSKPYVTGKAVGRTSLSVSYVTYANKYADADIIVTDSSVAVTGVSLNKTSTTISVGRTETLRATVSPSDATNTGIIWSSADESIATVSNGVVTGVGAGTTTITATTSDGGYTATCSVTVRQISVTGITLDKHSVTVGQNDVVTLTATISPDNASNTNINIRVRGDSTHVTSTTHDGNVWTINWKADANAGQAQITVTTVDGSYSDTCTMSIVSVTPVTGVSLNKSSLSLDVNNTSQLTATVSPNNATNKSVSWTSSDESVATVSSSGLVTAVGNGTATITVTTSSGGYTATCKVTVTTPVTGLALNTTSTSIHYSSISNITKTIVATITPSDASNKKVTWSSSNTDIVTVTQGGVIHGEALGTATITCKSVSNPSVSATCTVTVLPTIIISPSSATLTIGETKQLSVSTMPSGITVGWMSNNTNIATVSQNGLVEAKSAGTANITAGTNSYGWSNASVITVLMSTKHLQIINNDDNPIYYHTEDFGDRSLAAGSTTSVSLTQGDNLYIRTTDSISHTVDLDCNSVYTASSGYYKITFAKAEDGDSITVFR